MEIESPFGTDDNDIDLDAIVRDICVDMQARKTTSVHVARTARSLLAGTSRWMQARGLHAAL